MRQKEKENPVVIETTGFWCARGDLNPHARNEH